ncbi:hypothetical protein PG990_011005 [Apiospora arundinis]
MQFSNIALALQVIALASAAAIPNGAELDKRLKEAHSESTQVSYGPICHLHCKKDEGSASAPAPASEEGADLEKRLKPAKMVSTQVEQPIRNQKRSPIEVDVQQNNYCLPSNLNCPYKRRSEESVDKREPNSGRPEAHAQVTHVDHRLPGKREPNSGRPPAHADVTDVYFHRPGKRDPKVEVDVTQVNYCPDGRTGCHLPRAEPVVETRDTERPDAHAHSTHVDSHYPGN